MERIQINFAYNDRTLRIDSSESAIETEFEWPIAQIIPMGSVAVVRTAPEQGARDNRNVFAVDARGKIVWRVSKRVHVYPDSPYTNLSLQDGLLTLSNWDGLNLKIKPFTWEEVGSGYGR